MSSDDSIVKNEHIQSMSEILHRLAHLWHISIELTSIICIACYSCMRTRISMEMDVTKYSTVRMEKCTNDDNDYKTIETLKIVADTICV